MNLKLTLLILLIALFFFTSTGHTTASFSQGITALYYGDGPLGTVMRQIRLPRAILAMLVGASLGVCGAALQGYLRNPCRARFNRCVRICGTGRGYFLTDRFRDLCLDGSTYCSVFFCHLSSIASPVVGRPSRKLLDTYSSWNCGKRLSRRIYITGS